MREVVAGQHQLLQAQAIPQLGQQGFEPVIGKNEPAQGRRESPRGQCVNLISLEAYYAQLRALAQHGGYFGELIV